MAKYPAKFSIHKGKLGAFQAGILPPTWEMFKGKDKNGKEVTNFKVTREGSILIEMAPFLKEENGNKYYDWANKKVSFGLGISDIALMVGAGGEEVKLIHQNEETGESKTLMITPGEKDYIGTYMINLFVSKNGEKNSSKIAFSAGEWNVFLSLLRAELPVMLGWDKAGE